MRRVNGVSFVSGMAMEDRVFKFEAYSDSDSHQHGELVSLVTAVRTVRELAIRYAQNANDAGWLASRDVTSDALCQMISRSKKLRKINIGSATLDKIAAEAGAVAISNGYDWTDADVKRFAQRVIIEDARIEFLDKCGTSIRIYLPGCSPVETFAMVRGTDKSKQEHKWRLLQKAREVSVTTQVELAIDFGCVSFAFDPFAGARDTVITSDTLDSDEVEKILTAQRKQTELALRQTCVACAV